MNLRNLRMEDVAASLGHVTVVKRDERGRVTDPSSPLYVRPALTVAALRDELARYPDTAIVVVTVPAGCRSVVLTDEVYSDPGTVAVTGRTYDERDVA